MNKNIQILIDFVEKKISPVEFAQLLYNNSELENKINAEVAPIFCHITKRSELPYVSLISFDYNDLSGNNGVQDALHAVKCILHELKISYEVPKEPSVDTKKLCRISSQQEGYKYFRYPHEFSNYLEEKVPCDVCHKQSVGYSIGTEPLHVCEPCFKKGALIKLEEQTNEGSPSQLKAQLKNMYPEKSDKQISEIRKRAYFCSSSFNSYTFIVATFFLARALR